MTINQSVFGQVIPQIEWVQNYSERDQIVNIPSAIDANNNVYITGYTFTGTTRNYTTIKYDQNGNLLWVQSYSGIPSGDDRSHAIQLDAQGNVYVTGESEGSTSQKDIATVKYDANGNQLWVERFNGGSNANDFAYSLDTDAQGNVYVSGKSQNASGNFDAVVVKYNSSGVQQWVNTYSVAPTQEVKSIKKGAGNRLFALISATNNNEEAHLIRINSNNGNQVGSIVFSGANDVYKPYQLALQNNNVIIVGSNTVSSGNTGEDYFMASINGNNANINWQATYDAFNGNDYATDVKTDGNGNVLLTGVADNNGVLEYHTLKYDPSGNQQWVNKETINGGFVFGLPSLETDNFDHLYVCGERQQTTRDVLMYQITPGGNTSWVETHNGAQNGIDAGVDLVYAGNGDLYVAAQTQNSNAEFDYTTIKIKQHPVYFPIDINNESSNRLHAYFENKGQLLKTNGSVAEEVLYSANNPGHETFILNDRFSYVFSELDTANNIRSQVQRVDVEFPGHDLNSSPAHFEAINFKQNYYLPHCGPGGITGVDGYERLLFPEFYRNIDLHIYNNDLGIKYYFVVMPGGDPTQIIHEFTGADTVLIDGNGQLNIVTFDDTTVFDHPKGYQMLPTMNMLPLSNLTWQNPANGDFTIGLPSYNSALPLVIQIDKGEVPNVNRERSEDNLIWSTYYGGQGITRFSAVSNDDQGNVYYAGFATGNDFADVQDLSTNVPYQSDRDAVVVELNSDIEPQWATYYGGAATNWTSGQANEFANTIESNSAGTSLYLAGNTSSTDLTITGSGYSDAANTSASGNLEGFIVRLDGNGILQWSTYFGETEDERLLDIALEESTDKLYVVGSRSASTTIQNQAGAENYNTGNGLFLQFDNATNNLEWANAWDCEVINAVDTDPVFGRAYFTGTTTFNGSPNLPVLNPDPDFPSTTSNQTQRDAFLSCVEETGVLLYSFFYGGDDFERGQDLVVNNRGTVFVTGVKHRLSVPPLNLNADLPSTGGGLPLPTTNNYYHGFIFRVDEFNAPPANISATTYFGGNGYDDQFRIATDNLRIYVTGTTSTQVVGTANNTNINFPFPSPPGLYFKQSRRAFDPEIDSDSFIACFLRSNLELIWSTYFGGNNAERGNGLSYSSADERLYFCGSTTTNNSLLSPSDNFLPNFDFDDNNLNDYWQEFPFQDTDLPAWAAFFEVAILDDPNLNTNNVVSIEDELLVYPNPVKDQIYIRSSSGIEEITVMSISGQQIYASSIVEGEVSIPVGQLSQGMYIISVKTKKGIQTKKFIKE